MKGTHEGGCNGLHPARQSCTVPRIADDLNVGLSLAPREAGIAVIAELLPLVAGLCAVSCAIAFIMLNIATGFEPPAGLTALGFFLLVAASCAQGIGWKLAGKRSIAAALLAFRVLLVLITFTAGIAAVAKPGCSGCEVDYSPLVFAGVMFAISLLVPVASALALRSKLKRRPERADRESTTQPVSS